jgi:hypothetical protein
MKRLEGLPGQQFGILRQELDSMIRVIYLLRLNLPDRETVAKGVLAGQGFCYANGRRITDRDMLVVAEKLHGWSRNVYTFGCAFIHLSSLHAYASVDPLDQLTSDERHTIADHINYYHGARLTERSHFADLIPFLPRVLAKITGNLSCYLDNLEEGESIDNP